MLKVEDYALYSLEEIEAETDENIKNQILRKRDQELRAMAANRLHSQIISNHYDDPLVEIDEWVEMEILPHTSHSLFSGDEVLLYPQFQECRAAKMMTCDISGGRIHIGSYYLRYQAFLDNLTTGKRYVLKRPWRAEIGSYDFFPRNICDMDTLDITLRNSYELSTEFSYSPYDYYAIATRIGDGVQLRELGKSNYQRKKLRQKIKKLGRY